MSVPLEEPKTTCKDQNKNIGVQKDPNIPLVVLPGTSVVVRWAVNRWVLTCWLHSIRFDVTIALHLIAVLLSMSINLVYEALA